jgi:hypothetical protein
MNDKTKDIFQNEKTPIRLTTEEFIEYSRNVKSIYSNIGLFAISFFLLGAAVLFIAALQYLNILKVSDTVTYIMAAGCLVLFVLLCISLFKKIINTSKRIYLDKIIIIDEKLLNELQRKQKWYKFKVIAMALATLVLCIFGVILIILTENRYPGNSGYIILSVISMFLMVSVPFFLAIYFYSDIYIYDYINKRYNF